MTAYSSFSSCHAATETYDHMYITCSLRGGHDGYHVSDKGDKWSTDSLAPPTPPPSGSTIVASNPPTRATSALTEAHDLIYGARAQSYGPAREHFTDVANLWSVVLAHEISAEQVALCLTLLKIARLAPGLTHENMRPHHDSIVDAAGYLGLIEKMGDDQ